MADEEAGYVPVPAELQDLPPDLLEAHIDAAVQAFMFHVEQQAEDLPLCPTLTIKQPQLRMLWQKFFAGRDRVEWWQWWNHFPGRLWEAVPDFSNTDLQVLEGLLATEPSKFAFRDAVDRWDLATLSVDELRLAFPGDCNLVQRIRAMLAEEPAAVAQGAGAGVNATGAQASGLMVLVQGQRMGCSPTTAARCKTLHQFLEAKEHGDTSHSHHSSALAPEAACFPLQGDGLGLEWVTRELWRSFQEFPGLRVPEGQPLLHAEVREYLEHNWQQLTDIARLADFLDCAQLVDLCTSALLVHVRQLLLTFCVEGQPVPLDQWRAGLETAPSAETLRLLLSPITFHEDCVHVLSPQQFTNLREEINDMRLLPRAGILRGLLRARIFPYTRLRAERSDHEMVRSKDGDGCRKEYVKLELPLEQLRNSTIQALACSVTSHDQGFGGDPAHRNTHEGSYTFGKLQVAGRELPDRLYTNLTAVGEYKMYRTTYKPGSELIEMVHSAVAAYDSYEQSQQLLGEEGGEGGQGQAQPGEGQEHGQQVGAQAQGQPQHAGNGGQAQAQQAGNAASAQPLGVARRLPDGSIVFDVSLVMHAYFSRWENHVSHANLECLLCPEDAVGAEAPPDLCLPPTAADLQQLGLAAPPIINILPPPVMPGTAMRLVLGPIGGRFLGVCKGPHLTSQLEVLQQYKDTSIKSYAMLVDSHDDAVEWQVMSGGVEIGAGQALATSEPVSLSCRVRGHKVWLCAYDGNSEALRVGALPQVVLTTNDSTWERWVLRKTADGNVTLESHEWGLFLTADEATGTLTLEQQQSAQSQYWQWALR